MKTWTDCTSNIISLTVGNCTAGSIIAPCMRCVVERKFSRANQHQRREYGMCVICGKRFIRLIKWTTKDARAWWEAA